jgi:hypothetical protein
MRCAKCGAEDRYGAKFCKCAAPIPAKCSSCGAAVQPGSKFCDECGTALNQSPRAKLIEPNDAAIRVADAPASENLEGERKTVTVLFADINGSMDLIEDLDPEDARAIVDSA